MRVQNSSCCFSRELVSFVRPRELVNFNSRYVTRCAPIENVFELGGITKIYVSVNLYKCTFSCDRTIKKLQVKGYLITFPNEQKRVF